MFRTISIPRLRLDQAAPVGYSLVQASLATAVTLVPFAQGVEPRWPPASYAAFFVGRSASDQFGIAKCAVAAICALFAMLGWLIGPLTLKQSSSALLTTGLLIVALVASGLLGPFGDLIVWGDPGYRLGLAAVVPAAVLGLIAATADRQTSTMLLWALGLGTLFQGLLGVAELMGIPWRDTALVKHLVVGPYRREFELAALSPAGVTVAMSNRNYVGAYSALTWPLFVVMAAAAGSWRRGCAWLACALGAWVLLLGSLSRASLIGGAAAGGVAALCAWRLSTVRGGGPWWPGLGLLRRFGTIALCHGLLGIWVFKTLGVDAVHHWQPEPKVAADSAVSEQERPPQVLAPGATMKLENGRLHLRTSPPGLIFERFATGIKVMDESFRPLPLVDRGDSVAIDDPLFRSFRLRRSLIGGLPAMEVIKGDDPAMVVVATPQGLRVLRRHALIAPEDPPLGTGPLPDLAMSGRGYIWNRTLPLLSRTWLLGRGPGAFIVDFPNREAFNIVRVFGRWWVHVDKPHNMYFQVAHAAGNAAGLLFAVSLLFVTVRCFRAGRPMTVALGAGLLGFAISGMANDLTPDTTAVFAILWGLAAGQSRFPDKAVSGYQSPP